jgi:DNA-binding MarR family transcriptional regulator
MSVANELAESIQRLSHLMADMEKEALAKAMTKTFSNEVTLTQLIYLDRIYELGSPTFTQLTESLKLAKPTVTNTINKLMADGYVNKTQATTDKRVYHLRLTPKGKNAVETFRDVNRAHIDRLVSILEPDEMPRILVLVDKIIARLSE